MLVMLLTLLDLLAVSVAGQPGCKQSSSLLFQFIAFLIGQGLLQQARWKRLAQLWANFQWPLHLHSQAWCCVSVMMVMVALAAGLDLVFLLADSMRDIWRGLKLVSFLQNKCHIEKNQTHERADAKARKENHGS